MPTARVSTATMRGGVARSEASRTQLATILESLDIAICVASLDDGALLLTNSQFRERFGPDSVDIAGVEQGFAVAPSQRFPASALVDESGEPCGASVGEFHCIDDQRSYLVRALAIRWTPLRLARLHALVDITPRAESQRFQRTQQEKLLLTSRLMAVSELASTLAHELNQPLGAVTNFVQGAVRRLRNGAADMDAVIDALSQAQLQAEHAAKVVSRMREFVRTREPHREPVRIGELVHEVARLMEPEAQKHRVRLSLHLPEALPEVWADRVMIEQVVLNLAKNAIEAMESTPVPERDLSIGVQINADGLMEVAVEDAGCGLTGQAQEQLFSPFFTTKPDGMGIGLSICRSIVEYHGGGLFFASHPTGGTKFWFTLPLGE